MKYGAKNQLTGTVKEIKRGTVMSQPLHRPAGSAGRREHGGSGRTRRLGGTGTITARLAVGTAIQSVSLHPRRLTTPGSDI